MNWQGAHPNFHMDQLGLIPFFLDERDPRPVKEQIEANYQHGGGWRPIKGFKFGKLGELLYPEDPPYQPIAISRLRDELVVFYTCQLLMVLQPDGSFEVARID